MSDTAESSDTAKSCYVKVLSAASVGWASRDVGAIIACHTEDTTFENHGLSPLAQGREAVRQAFRSVLDTNPDLITKKLRTTFGPGHAIVEYEVYVTMRGAPMSASAVDVFRFEKGLIASKDTWIAALKAV